MPYITEGLKHQFATNIELVAQEKGKLRKLVQEEEIETEVAYFETASNIEALPRTRTDLGGAPGGYGTYVADPANPVLADTELRFPQITRRQINAAAYYWTATMDRNDKANLLADPTSKFPQMAGLAMARAMDRTIIKSIGSPVMSGLTGTTAIPFDMINNVVPLGLLANDGATLGFHNDNGSQNFQLLPIGDDADADHVSVANLQKAKLTVEKLIAARQMLNRGTFNSDKKMYFVCTSQQLTDLLADHRIINADYNSVKALVNGELNSFMGFTFIISELLTGIAGPRNANDPVVAHSYSIRECFAFTEDAIRFASVKGTSITKTDELPMKHYAPMLYHGSSFGAARASEGGVVIIKCLEPARPDHHGVNGWVQPIAAGDDADQRTARLTRASVVPSHATTWATNSFDNTGGLAHFGNAGQIQAALLAIAQKRL